MAVHKLGSLGPAPHHVIGIDPLTVGCFVCGATPGCPCVDMKRGRAAHAIRERLSLVEASADDLKLPLLNKAGSLLGYALVDHVDAWTLEFRWSLIGRYAGRGTRVGGINKRILLHRDLMELHPGDGLEVDHVNGDGLDNRRSNLRVVTRSQNMQNVRRFREGRASNYRGVFLEDASGLAKPWRVRHILNGRSISGGMYATEDEAGAAAEAWRAVHMPYSQEVV